MSRGILLVGSGGHARSCIEVIESSLTFDVFGLIGLAEEVGQSIFGHRILGTDEQLHDFIRQCPDALVALGQIKTPDLRIKIFETLQSLGAQLPAIIASTATVSKHAKVGAGTIVMHGAVINAGAAIGDNVILNSQCLVEHDAIIGNHCHISTGAILNGGVVVGEGTFIGSGSIVHQRIQIGSFNVVGAGAVIAKDLPARSFGILP